MLFFPASRITKNALDLFKNSLKFFVKLYPSEIANEKMIFRNLIFIALLFFIMLIFPSIFLFFKIKPIYNIIELFLFVAAIMLIFRVSNLTHAFIKRHELKFNKFSEKYKLLLRKRMKAKKVPNKNEK